MSSFWTSRPGFAGARSFLRRHLRDGIILPGAFCLALSVMSCDAFSPSSTSTTAETSASAPPPGVVERPLEPGQLGRKIGPDGLPTLEGPKGVNVSPDTLFTEDIRDPIERIKRLENAVIEMRKDFDATLPAIRRLVGVEKDMQTLMAQLETLTGENPDALSSAGSALPPANPPLPAPAVTAMPLPSAPQARNSAPQPPVPAVPESKVAQTTTPAHPETLAPIPPAAPAKSEKATAPAAPPSPAAIPDNAEKTAQAPPQSLTPLSGAPPPPDFAARPPPEAPSPAATPPPNPPPKADLLAVTTAKPAPTAEPAPVPSPAPGVQASSGGKTSGIQALGLRLGEDKGKTRVVVDTTGPVQAHHADLDNDEHLLVLELKGAGWSGPEKKALTSPLVKEYSTQALEDGSGTRVILVLKKDATVSFDKVLAPEGGNSHYRLVVDLKHG